MGWETAVKWKLLSVNPPVKPTTASKPIVFDFQQESAPRQMPREVIETPQDAKTVKNQKEARFLSDKNAAASNPQANPDLKLGDPYSKGVFDTHDLTTTRKPTGENPPPAAAQKQEQPSEEQPKEYGDLSVQNLLNRMNLDFMGNGKGKPTNRPGDPEQIPGVPHDNLDSRALESGGLSFNTYNWDYAPYMLMLKRRIQRNIFPPAAFTYLGMIGGETYLRFKIYPDGRMRDLVILKYAGHKVLMETSYNAVDISAPFPPLPSGFPEKYLEVTGKFIYFVYK